MTPYEVLGVSFDATDAEVEAAYHRLVKLHHPDRHADADRGRRAAAETRTRELNAAMAHIRSIRSWGMSGTGDRTSGDAPPDPYEEERRMARLTHLTRDVRDPAVVDRASGARSGGWSGEATPASTERLGTLLAAVLILVVAALVLLAVTVLF